MQLSAAQVQPSATLLQPSGGVEGCSGIPITVRVLTWCNPLQPFFTSISTQKKKSSGRGREKHEGVNRKTGLQRVAGLQQLAVFDAGAPPTRRSKESESALCAIFNAYTPAHIEDGPSAHLDPLRLVRAAPPATRSQKRANSSPSIINERCGTLAIAGESTAGESCIPSRLPPAVCPDRGRTL